MVNEKAHGCVVGYSIRRPGVLSERWHESFCDLKRRLVTLQALWILLSRYLLNHSVCRGALLA